MKLPIDVSGLSFLVALAPAPVTDFETKMPKADENGQPLFNVQLVALGDSDAEILAVKFAGAPSALVQGTPVKVTGLVASPWTMGERSGVSFRAAGIEPLAPHAGRGGGEDKAGRS